MPLQSLPPSAEAYARVQRAEVGAAVSAVKRQWGWMGKDFDASFAGIEPRLLQVMDLAQERLTVAALAFVPQVLAETGQTRSVQGRYEIPPRTFVGTSGDGLGTDTLAYRAVVTAKSAVGQGAPVSDALKLGGQFLTTAVGTMLSDTRRGAEQMGTQARPVTGFVRMLEAPSCGRCVVLAGKWTRASAAFLRHPKCDCINIPSSENMAGSMLTDPHAHLDGLSDDDLARTLGSKVNAQAFRDGADPQQLINAYRKAGAVQTAQVYGKTVKYTTEGVTRRGTFGRSARTAGLDLKRTPRLMPASIYQIAESKQDADRLLRLYGWIL